MAALVATLVTIGVLTKNSELIVMRACGISLYRSALPLCSSPSCFSARAVRACRSGCSRSSNREADRLNAMIRGYPPPTFGVLNRRWIVGTSGDIYHYELFDPRVEPVQPLSMFHLDERAWRLASLTYASEAALVSQPGADDRPALMWMARDGWTREFTTVGRARQRDARS